MVLFVLSTILALILRYWGEPMLVNLYIYHLDVCTSSKCLGIGGVNRISFALFVFFFLHFLSLKFVTSCARLDRGSWWTKSFGFIVLLVLAWLIPDDFYVSQHTLSGVAATHRASLRLSLPVCFPCGCVALLIVFLRVLLLCLQGVYMHISRVVSAFFLLLQLVILIDFAYGWQESWTEKGWNKPVLAVCVLLYAASLTAFVLDLVYLGGGQGGGTCPLQKFFIAFTFCLTFITTALSISSWIGEGGGLLPAGCITLYSYWLLFTALTSDPSECNTVSSRSKEIVPMIIGLLMTTMSITYACWSVATSTALFDEPLRPQSSPGGSGDADSEERGVQVRGKSDAAADDDDDDGVLVESPASAEKAAFSARFHGMMSCASMYLCMLLSEWGSQQSAEDDGTHSDLSTANMWIKMSTQWACILLYVWTLVAPIVCKGRQFN